MTAIQEVLEGPLLLALFGSLLVGHLGHAIEEVHLDVLQHLIPQLVLSVELLLEDVDLLVKTLQLMEHLILRHQHMDL